MASYQVDKLVCCHSDRLLGLQIAMIFGWQVGRVGRLATCKTLRWQVSNLQDAGLAGWHIGRLVGLQVGTLGGWQIGMFTSWQVSNLAGWQVYRLAGWKDSG